MINTLHMIAQTLNRNQIQWGLGGSFLLYLHQIIEKPNDIDLIIARKDMPRCRELLKNVGEEKQVEKKSPFRTKSFYHFKVNEVGVDVMSDFAIAHLSGVYTMPLNEEHLSVKTISDERIFLCCLEDWYIMYQLMPEKTEKAEWLEHYFLMYNQVNTFILRNALKQPLPDFISNRVHQLLENIQYKN
ncbi:hypothetical protein BTS2_2725 [Bacillus sp. TS-2]|nr:hypothetical protein BTS2_2725 [Bacillus sp. TS-2]